MSPAQEVDYILHDCLFAVGQTVGTEKRMDYDAVVWLRGRYRDRFLRAMEQNGNSWALDRNRVTAVGRYLGQRALHHAGERDAIDVACIAKASAEIEDACRMNAVREGVVPSGCRARECTNAGPPAF